MEDVDIDKMDIETNTDSHSIQCVASVSYDRQKKQFKYAGDHAQVFGKEKAEEMQAKQGKAIGAADNRFKLATKP